MTSVSPLHPEATKHKEPERMLAEPSLSLPHCGASIIQDIKKQTQQPITHCPHMWKAQGFVLFCFNV